MPRTARIIIPNMPHHIIQRGNRKQDVFFEKKDYLLYLSFLRDLSIQAGSDVLAYCLMSNHIHLIIKPKDENGLKFIGELHRKYARCINRKMDWTGHLWQDRYASYPMDDAYLYRALRYIELNPVRAGIYKTPEDYNWSSARQRLNKGHGDFKVKPSLQIENWQDYWRKGLLNRPETQALEQNETSQHPQIFQDSTLNNTRDSLN